MLRTLHSFVVSYPIMATLLHTEPKQNVLLRVAPVTYCPVVCYTMCNAIMVFIKTFLIDRKQDAYKLFTG